MRFFRDAKVTTGRGKQHTSMETSHAESIFTVIIKMIQEFIKE